MIISVEDDIYVLVIPDTSIILENDSGLDMFARRNGRWFINTGGKPTRWNNPLTDKYQIILESIFISERRENTIKELL